MTADDLMRLVNRYTEACDDLGAGLFNQTEAETNAKHAKAKELHGQILAEVYRLHAVAEKSERHVTIEAAHAMGASGAEGAGIEHSEPERLAFEAWKGAREDLAIWKRRALEAEELNRKFSAAINGPTFMGEPAPAAVPAVTRKDAEQAYAISAFDYVRDPVGSRDWTLFYAGWRAALAAKETR